MFSVFEELKKYSDISDVVEEEVPMRRTAIMKKKNDFEELDEEEINDAKNYVANNYQEPVSISTSQAMVTNVVIRQEFMWNVISTSTPVEVQTELFMKPIPKAVGLIQCTIVRDT